MADPFPLPAFTAKELDAIARRERGEPNRIILTELKVSGTWLSATFRKAGLPLRTAHTRRPPRVERDPPEAGAPALHPPAPPDGAGASLDRRLERLLSGRIAELEGRIASGRGGDPERIARALALNVRTLATLRRAAPGPDDDPPTDPPARPPRTIAQLRDELYGHLQRVRDEEKARRRLGRARAQPG